MKYARLFTSPDGAPHFEDVDVTLQAADTATCSPAVNPGRLSVREMGVLRLLTAGKINQEIAAALTVSVFTVNRHLSNILTKIGAANRRRGGES